MIFQVQMTTSALYYLVSSNPHFSPYQEILLYSFLGPILVVLQQKDDQMEGCGCLDLQ